MSLQIAILKLLVSHPEGRASVAALSADLTVLHSSGRDWTNRLSRLAARTSGLDIFGQKFVLRDKEGWQITADGKAFLESLEKDGLSDAPR